MSQYKPRNGIALIELGLFIVFGNVFLYGLRYLLGSYTERSLIVILMIAFTLYCVFYIFVAITLKFIVKETGIEINSLWGLKKVFIHYDSMDGYNVLEGNIQGMRLSGFGKYKYCFGRSVIDKVGIAHMFVTSNQRVLYIHTEEISYGISPKDIDPFIEVLNAKGKELGEFTTKIHKNKELYKEKSFFIPFILVTLIILFITLNPFVLYLMQKLPSTMPLYFDEKFRPVIMGTGKQFAFKQMTYGALNMIILFCMHYASYFCAKYDKRSAYKYIYISLLVATTFLFIQLRVLYMYL